MIGIRHTLRTSLFVAASLLLVACSPVENFADLQAFVDEINDRPGATVEPVPVFQPYEGFIYGASSLRSPFQVPIEIDFESGIIPAENVQPDLDRARELLETHSLSELAMVGMLTRGGVYEALIEDVFGEVHRVGIGNYIGRNFGRINRISETQLHIVEIVPSGSGGWIERPQTLMLQ